MQFHSVDLSSSDAIYHCVQTSRGQLMTKNYKVIVHCTNPTVVQGHSFFAELTINYPKLDR